MSKHYLSHLYDRFALRVLTNTRDFDARDETYSQQVSVVVWKTVRALREGRIRFHADIRREMQVKKRTKKLRVPRPPGG